MGGGGLLHPPKGIACAKACSSHSCKVRIMGKFAHDLSRFFKVLEEALTSKSIIISRE